MAQLHPQAFVGRVKAFWRNLRQLILVAAAWMSGGLLSQPSCALAEGTPLMPKEVGLRVGLSSGSVSVQETTPATLTKPQTTTKVTYQTGGIALLLSWHESLNDKLDSDYSAKVLIDRINNQLFSYGGEASLHWHLFGGSRRLTQGTENVVIKSYYDKNLSLVAKAGAHQYSSSVKGASFKGAAVELRAGLAYRQDLNRSLALGGEVTTTAFSLAMGSPTLTPRMSEFLLLVRYAP